MAHRWELLGAVRATLDGHVVEVAGRRQRAVLTLLLLEAGGRCSIERIIDELWPDDPPATARNSVQRFVADLRSAFGPFRELLATVEGGYRLDATATDLDDVDRAWRAAVDLPDEDITRFTAMEAVIDTMDAEVAPGVELAGLGDIRSRFRATRVDAMQQAADFALRAGLPAAATLERWGSTSRSMNTSRRQP